MIWEWVRGRERGGGVAQETEMQAVLSMTFLLESQYKWICAFTFVHKERKDSNRRM